MADAPQKLKTKILDVKRVSKFNFEYIVGVEFSDGETTWRKAFRFDIGRVPSMAEFKEQLRFVDPSPDTQQDLLDEHIGDEFEVEFVPQRKN